MDEFTSYLSSRNYRITTARKAVFTVLNAADKPIAIQDITKRARDIDRVSVYRTLELFTLLGIVEVVHVGWKKRYELAGPFKPHHHHLECTSCHELIAIDPEQLEQLIDSIARDHGYTLSSHHIELQGLCSMCRHNN